MAERIKSQTTFSVEEILRTEVIVNFKKMSKATVNYFASRKRYGIVDKDKKVIP